MDPWSVCDHFDVEVIKLSELLGEGGTRLGSHFLDVDTDVFSAVVIPRGMRTAIVHNDAHAPVRQRSNLFHELSHLFLGHPVKPLLSADGSRDRDGAVEEEAAFLGGCLAIPNEAACHIVDSGMQSAAAKTYCVSSSMLTYRLRVSGAFQIAARRASKLVTN
ncbi:MAG: ImmA/IrrE family metallo-endopeptidase [Janthinobacterium lividum]